MSSLTTEPTIRLPQQAEQKQSEKGFNLEGQNGIHAVLRHPPTLEGGAVTTGQENNHPSDSRPHDPESCMSMAGNIPAEPNRQGQLGLFQSGEHLDTLDWIRCNRARILAEGRVNQYGATIPGGGPREQHSNSPTLESLNADASSGNSEPLGDFMMDEKPKWRSRARCTPPQKREIPARPSSERSTADTSHNNLKRKVSVKTKSLSDGESIRDVSTPKQLRRSPKESAGTSGGSS